MDRTQRYETTTEEVENKVNEVAVKATKALSNATYTKEEALALEKEIRDALNRTRGKIVSTVKFCLKDTHLIRTPRYYGQFALPLGKESPYIFCKFS